MEVGRSRKPLTEERSLRPGRDTIRLNGGFNQSFTLNGEALNRGICNFVAGLWTDLSASSHSTVCNGQNPNLNIPLPALEVKCICTVPRAF